MLTIRECRDIEECSRLWDQVWPRECIFDLWEVRACFHRSFGRPPVFLVAEENSRVQGLLPLSWIDEEQYFGVFPGETWQGKTWLEQNKIPAVTSSIRQELLDSVPGNIHLRYISPEYRESDHAGVDVDETGYIFYPGDYNYSFSRYIKKLSSKFRKNCEREKSFIERHGISFRYDDNSDVEHLFRMNMEAFGESSYFADERFLHSFERLIAWLSGSGMLRIVTVIVGGNIAAVDIGSVLKGQYTVLAGGTNPEFAGVAKLINFRHLEYSCSHWFTSVDFLCGDFGWKERFHLTPRNLYQITAKPAVCAAPDNEYAFFKGYHGL